MWFRWFRRSSVLSGPIAALSIKHSKRSIPLLTFSSFFFPTSGHRNFRLVTLSSVSLSEIASNMALNLLVSMLCLNANTSNFQHYRIALFRFQLWRSLSLGLVKRRENPLPCVRKSPSFTALVGQLETRNDTRSPTSSVLLNQTVWNNESLLALSDSWVNCSFESIVLKCSQFTNQFHSWTGLKGLGVTNSGTR